MTEPNEIAFFEPVGKPGGAPTGNGHRRGGSLAMRVGIVAGSALLVLVGAIAAMGASPAPSSTTADPGASTAPATTPADPKIAGGPGFAFRGGEFGRGGFHDITITSIDGSDLALATDDGWTRTIAVTSTTTITKGGATITLADLAVGDQIVFGQARNADGTYTIAAIRVVLPTIAGEVTAISGNDITVTQRGGTTATIHVDADTTYKVWGETDASLSDIKVGSFIVAEGTQQADGSLDAAAVHSGFRGHGGRGEGIKGDRDHDGVVDPNASPAPSATPG